MTPHTALTSIQLPGVTVPLTKAVLGTMSFGDTANEAAATEIFEAAMDHGISGVDCANGYARGTTEALIAPLVNRYRDRIVLATKAGMPHPDAEGLAPLSAAAVRACVEGSLRRMQVDSVDIFYLHQPDRTTPVDETLTEVAALHREGKIGALGVSNYAAWQTLDIAAAAARAGAPAPVVGQNVYNLLARRMEDEWLEFADTHHVLTMCYNPLAGGLLVRDPRDGVSSRFTSSSLAQMYTGRYLTPELLTAVGKLAEVASEAGLGLPELAMRWLISQDSVGAVLLGGDQVEHLSANLDALLRGPLPAEVLTACEEISAPLKGPMPAYNR